MRPADTAPVPAEPGMPDDWPAQWQALLRRRQGLLPPPSHVPGEPDPSPASAAWLALYQPLLDARARARPGARRPWLVAQLGQSLDGCIATASGDSYFVTGPQSLLHLHRLRALCDAVLVGAGTVAADDPQLTTRRVPGPNAVRVVLDPKARLDGQARVFREDAAPTLWLCDRRHAAAARSRLGSSAAEVVAVEGLLREAVAADRRAGPGPMPMDAPARSPQPPEGPWPGASMGTVSSEGLDLAPAFAALADRGLGVVLVEGGGVTVSRCLQAGLLDRLHLVVAPVIVGAGRRGLNAPGPSRMADCLRPPARLQALGDDCLWDLDLRPNAGGVAGPGSAAFDPGHT